MTPFIKKRPHKYDPLPMGSGLDRRAAERFPLAVSVEYRISKSSKPTTGRTTATDVSGGGVKFRIPVAVERGALCHVRLRLPTRGRPISFSGRVAWCRTSSAGYEIAVVFSNQSAQNAVTFSRYCQFIAAQLLAKYLA